MHTQLRGTCELYQFGTNTTPHPRLECFHSIVSCSTQPHDTWVMSHDYTEAQSPIKPGLGSLSFNSSPNPKHTSERSWRERRARPSVVCTLCYGRVTLPLRPCPLLGQTAQTWRCALRVWGTVQNAVRDALVNQGSHTHTTPLKSSPFRVWGTHKEKRGEPEGSPRKPYIEHKEEQI